MPSVGMRHSTKAFLPKPVGKDGELGTSTTLLRSGKGDEIACYKSNGWRKVIPEQEFTQMDIDDVCALEERKFKNVYDRKRRRSPQAKEDPLYGISYTRKRFKKIGRGGNSTGASVSDFLGRLGIESYPVLAPGETLDFTIYNSSQSTQVLVSILEFMRSSNVTLPELAAHMCRESIVRVLSRRGVYFKLVSGSCHDEGLLSTGSFSCLVFFFSSSNLFLGAQSFSPGPTFPYYINLSGLCRIFGEQTSVPLFWLNFPAAPLSFVNLHATLVLRSLYQPHDLIIFWAGIYHSVDLHTAGKNVSPFLPAGIYCNDDGMYSINSSVEKNSSDFGVPGFKLDWRSASTRHAVYRNFQRKRSSLRSKRSNGSLSMGLHGLQHFNANNKLKIKNPGKKNRLSPPLGFEMIRTIGSRRPPLATLKSNVKQTTLLKKNVLQNDKEVKSVLVGSGQNVDSTYCTANVLVIESDRGYREEGVTIMLECSSSNVWHLVVKAHGSIKYIHQALDVMKPCSTNRFTHALIWTPDNGWKLEFCDRKDWLVFKELYKECISRNIEVNSSKTIPVPGVREVLNYDDGERVRFSRPDSYITAPSNEVARALAKKTSIYEIGQDDEEWLEKLNSGLANGDSDVAEYLSAEKFEDIIDMFEKTAYCSPGDISDESKFTSLCSDMGRDDIVVAVYKYWLKKRKQNRSALLRVFECQPPRKTPVEQENVCRKRRSSKRHPSQNGRDRQRSLLQGMSADQNELHVKRAEEDLSKEAKEAQEAVSNAERSAVRAIAMRKKAQILMAVSDRATYYASMALQIAERAQLAESSSNAPDDLLPKPSE